MDVSAVPEESEPSSPVGRRRFLMYLAAAPTLTIIGRTATEGEAAAAGGAATQIPTPTATEAVDLGDAITLLSAPHAVFLRLGIGADGRVWFECPKLEMGQGINTTVAMMIAEELDVQPADVDVRMSDAREELGVMQFCAFSISVRSLWQPLAAMAAAARARLLTAAGQRWGVPATALTVDDAAVIAPDGRRLSYGELSLSAAQVREPIAPALPKPVEQHRVLGRPTGKIDVRDIVTGRAKYVSDTAVPGALVAVVVRPPTIRGEVAFYDDAAARAMPGVRAVVQIPSGVAVCAEDTWQAMQAAERVEVTWKPGPGADRSDEDIFAELAANTGRSSGAELPDGDFDERFDVAFQSHAPMETGVAIADVRDGHAEVWCASQIPIEVKRQVAPAIGLPESAVTVHVTRAGGSFGRNCYHDAPIEAAQISLAVGNPVKVLWTRSDDTRHGRMGTSAHQRITASVRGGEVVAYHHQVASAATDVSCGIGDIAMSALMKIEGKTETTTRVVGGAFMVNMTQIIQYDYGLATMSGVDVPVDIPNTGTWRGVMSPRFRIAEELMADRLAEHVGLDPVEFRLRHLNNERTKAVLRKVVTEGRWGRSMPEGHAQGVGVHEEHRSTIAALVDIDARDPQNPRVTRAVLAVDVGRAFNPRGVEAQVQGGLMDGIATVLYAGLHIDGGAVRESSFSDYRWTRQRHAPPEVEVFVMPPTGQPGGLGDTVVPGPAAAVANAYARATRTAPAMFPINF